MRTVEISDGDAQVTISGGPFRFHITHSAYPGTVVPAVFPSRDWWQAATTWASSRTAGVLAKWAHR